mmetsp:Transcript_34055/g.86163  ORF Transcript_34055/g.86163 Transcript_34055/m.86163 type:complete len:222 (+) Transcript_34055:70-735(+)
MAPGHRHASWRPSTGVITTDGQVQWPLDPLTGLAESVPEASRRGRRWPPLQVARRGTSAPARPRPCLHGSSVGSGGGGSGCRRLLEAWHPAGRHRSQRSRRGSCKQAEVGHERLQHPDADALPWYHGWPSGGPSQDLLLLKTRQARLQGHVDWVRWSKEVADEDMSIAATPHPPRPMRAQWCPNYGVVGQDGSIIWPSEDPWCEQEQEEQEERFWPERKSA